MKEEVGLGRSCQPQTFKLISRAPAAGHRLQGGEDVWAGWERAGPARSIIAA